MSKNSLTEPSSRKRQWFARRQVYLRTGQDSQYVELSPLLQVGTALGFGVLALWLVGASYSAVTTYFGEKERTGLLAQLSSAEQALGDVERERDAALGEAARVVDLETALANAQVKVDETLGLTTELEQTKAQLEELHRQLSESKSDQAALQAKFEAEALATTNSSEKTAEEASSLHAQLEDAFGEIETLKKERDLSLAKIAALNQESVAKDEVTERNTALLKAATAEIERLQGNIALADTEVEERVKGYETTIGKLEEKLGEVVSARDDLEREVAGLTTELAEAREAATEASKVAATAETGANASADAEMHAQLIAAGIENADLMATIESLRTELMAAPVDGGTESVSEEVEDSDEVQSLRERVAIAEAEIERLIVSRLKEDDERVDPSATVPENAAAPPEDPAETEALRSELLAAQADIIKLNADVKATKQRLTEQIEVQDGQISKPNNTAKLEQQLASTRSRVQQLNKALANAKLREVAIDLALINVVPSPSPPAPR